MTKTKEKTRKAIRIRKIARTNSSLHGGRLNTGPRVSRSKSCAFLYSTVHWSSSLTLHDSHLRHPLSAPVGWHRTFCRDSRAQCKRLRRRWTESSGSDRDGNRVCYLVWRRSGDGNFGHVCQGGPPGRCRRSIWFEPLPRARRRPLCAAFLSAQLAHGRGLLPPPVRPPGRGALHPVHRGVLCRLGRSTVQSARPCLECCDPRCSEPASRHGDRCVNRADLYDVRGHVFRGDPGPCATLRHRGWITVYRERREQFDRWGGSRNQPCVTGRKAGILSSRLGQGLDSLPRSWCDDDAWVHPTARRISAHYECEE